MARQILNHRTTRKAPPPLSFFNLIFFVCLVEFLCCCSCCFFYHTTWHWCSVAKSCPTLRPHGLSTLGFLVLNYLRSLLRLVSIELVIHPTISSSAALFFFCVRSFPASGSLSVSQFFASGGQRIGSLASTSVLPMTVQGGFPLDWLVWSPCYPRDSQGSSPGNMWNLNSPTRDWTHVPCIARQILHP